MVSSGGITDTIKNLSDLQTRCNLRQADSDRFFHEWIDDLPQLNQQTLIDFLSDNAFFEFNYS